MSSEPQPNADTHLPRGSHLQNKDKIYQAGDLNNYVDTCVTVAKAIRWLTFALSLCSGSLLLLIAIFYLGNLSYALERRKEVQKQCFDKPSESDEGCRNFINDTWNNEMRYGPLSLSANSDTAYAFARERNHETYLAFRKLEGEMRIIQLPLINIKLLNTDFALILVLLSLFFLYWLRLNLEFARNTLCSLYNDASAANQAARTVPTHFVLLWPGGSRRRSHWAFWAILYSVVMSGTILILTDIYDFFLKGYGQSMATHQKAGWDIFSHYAYGKIFIELAMMILAAYLIYKLRSIIRDVRNLLLLIEWAPKALHPLLYRLFDREESLTPKGTGKNSEESQLIEGANESSYDEYGPGFFCLRIRLTFPKATNGARPEDSSEEYRFYARIDLWRSALDESSFRRVKRTRLFSDEEWAHSLAEERRMRRFFFNILTNPAIERELCHEFWKIAKSRKLQGDWMKKCENEFSHESRRSHATTTEIVRRIEDYEE